jgi:hypothetical protein
MPVVLLKGRHTQRSVAHRSSSGMSALRWWPRFTVIGRRAAQTPGRGSAVPLSQRSTVCPGRRTDGEGPPLRGKSGSTRGSWKNEGAPFGNRGRFGKLIGRSATGVPVVPLGRAGTGTEKDLGVGVGKLRSGPKAAARPLCASAPELIE